MLSVTKQYRDLPAAHRQPKHNGHCRLIHGHNWGFDITFTCDTLDSNGFVVDVGKLTSIKEWLAAKFDHTLLLNEEDPMLGELKIKLVDFAKIVVVPNCGMEGLAKFVYEEVNKLLQIDHNWQARNLRVDQVVCLEDAKNSATYRK